MNVYPSIPVTSPTRPNFQVLYQFSLQRGFYDDFPFVVELYDAVVESQKNVDILINCAGVLCDRQPNLAISVNLVCFGLAVRLFSTIIKQSLKLTDGHDQKFSDCNGPNGKAQERARWNDLERSFYRGSDV